MQLNHVPANSLSLSYFYVQYCRRLKFAVIIINIDLNDYTKARKMRNRIETYHLFWVLSNLQHTRRDKFGKGYKNWTYVILSEQTTPPSIPILISKRCLIHLHGFRSYWLLHWFAMNGFMEALNPHKPHLSGLLQCYQLIPNCLKFFFVYCKWHRL